MPMFVDASGFTLEAETDVATGATSDAGNVSFVDVADPTVFQVQYAQALSGFGQDRLTQLVNVTNNLVVSGVDSTFVINGGPISNNAGVTFVDGSGVIRCIYDVTQCGGSGYFVFDSGGNKIAFPNFCLIGHEMSHGFHIDNGDTSANPEFQAETDEDGYRAQNGLPLRDPNNHSGGCGLAGGPPPPPTCVIATAAYGSTYAPQLYQVRQMRDVVLRQSAWGSEFFDRMHEEYYRFSPQVAARMNRSGDVREALSMLVVEPYFEFLAVLKAYASRGEAAAAVAESGLQRVAARLSKAGIQDAGAVAGALAALKARLRSDVRGEDHASAGFDPSDGAGPFQILDALCAAVEAVTPVGGHVAWGLLDPLILFWKAASSPEGAGIPLLRAMSDWMLSAPLPSCYAAIPEPEVVSDLAYLASTLFTSSEVRGAIAERLLREGGARPDLLTAALVRAGYLVVN